MLKHLFTYCLILSSFISTAQEKQWEIGYLMGTSQFLGEMGDSKNEGRPFIYDLQWKLTGLNFGGYVRYHYTPMIAFRANFIYGRLSGADSLSENPERSNRNLHFKSHVIELSGLLEIQLYKTSGIRGFKNVLRSASVSKRIGKNQAEIYVYGFIGIGMFHFNPKAEYKGKWYSLQPLGTEGQGVPGSEKKYKRIQACIPMGLEAFFTTNPKVYRIGLELGWRYTFSDYIDDISGKYADPDQIEKYNGSIARALSSRAVVDPANASKGSPRGDPKDKDSYIFTVINFTYIIGRQKQEYPKYKKAWSE